MPDLTAGVGATGAVVADDGPVNPGTAATAPATPEGAGAVPETGAAEDAAEDLASVGWTTVGSFTTW